MCNLCVCIGALYYVPGQVLIRTGEGCGSRAVSKGGEGREELVNDSAPHHTLTTGHAYLVRHRVFRHELEKDAVRNKRELFRHCWSHGL